MLHDAIWNERSVVSLFERSLFELVQLAYTQHQKYFRKNIELCTLLSIKTGRCPEDCAYCPQSGHYNTKLKYERLLDIKVVVEKAKIAKSNGARRFCMGAAWKSPPKKDFPKVLAMIEQVKSLGLETCVTLGMLDKEQASQLKEAGLDYYNHNLDTSPRFYKTIITTRTYQDRINTIEHLVAANIHVCCGGIIGMGESRNDRIQFLLALNRLPVKPKSIPINKLIAIKGTPLQDVSELDRFEFIKTIAVTRLMFHKSMIRLSAGREGMSDEMQAWCYMAGANSIFIGDKLLTVGNANMTDDLSLLNKLGLTTATGSFECNNDD